MTLNVKLNNKIKEKKNNTEDIKIFGFWIYLMSDCILFAALFISYLVLKDNTSDPSLNQNIFNIPLIFAETCCLLFSSLTYDTATSIINCNKKIKVIFWLSITFTAGLSFIFMEFYEFYHLIKKGYGPWYNACFSGFFTLIGTHGLHVISGLIWILVMIIHIIYNGFNNINKIRLQCLSLFWHFLDIIWIIIFTTVYLIGFIKQ